VTAYLYSVRARADRAETVDRFVSWLVAGHAREVIQAGALTATIVRTGPDSAEVLYEFANEAAFEAYERLHAPRLRQHGLDRFGPASADPVRFERARGPVVGSIGAGHAQGAHSVP
jgi:hypothetical protein